MVFTQSVSSAFRAIKKEKQARPPSSLAYPADAAAKQIHIFPAFFLEKPTKYHKIDFYPELVK